MPEKKLVVFVTSDLELSFKRGFSALTDWQQEFHLSDKDGAVNLTNIDQLTKVLQGVDCCVIVTHTDLETVTQAELAQGRCLAEACKKAAVKHIIFSGHLSCEKTIGIPARHYDNKADIYHLMRYELELPVTMVSIPPLYEIFYDFLCPTLNSHKYEVAFPSVGPAPLDFIARDDIAPCILPVIENPQVFMLKTVALCGEKINGKIVTTTFNELIPDLKFVQQQVTVQEVRGKNFVGAIDIANMFEFLSRVDLKASPSGTRELHPATKNFSAWVSQNADSLQTTFIHSQKDPTNLATVI